MVPEEGPRRCPLCNARPVRSPRPGVRFRPDWAFIFDPNIHAAAALTLRHLLDDAHVTTPQPAREALQAHSQLPRFEIILDHAHHLARCYTTRRRTSSPYALPETKVHSPPASWASPDRTALAPWRRNGNSRTRHLRLLPSECLTPTHHCERHKNVQHMRWLQLCDLHLGAADESQELAMAQIIDAIAQHLPQGTLDLVVLAGDLAYSGTADEYKRVSTQIIQPLRQIPAIADATFLSVPGNHDLDCNVSHPLTWNTLGKTRQDIFWNSDKDGIAVRAPRAAGFRAYSRFLKENAIQGPNPLDEIGSIVELPDITFICLNTALFSDKEFSSDEEKGKSPLPVHTLRHLCHRHVRDGTRLLVVGHHPISWFSLRSKNHFQAALDDLHTFYLHGHEHRVIVSFGASALRSLGFGATYPARLDSTSRPPYTSTFTFCELRNYLHAQFICWDSDNAAWRPCHKLPSELRARSQILRDGYTIPIPTTRSRLLPRQERLQSHDIEGEPALEPPIWIDAAGIRAWTALLHEIGVIEEPVSITEQNAIEIPSHSTFLLGDARGNHLIHVANAETAVLTYEHVERANTQIDTLQLSSCVLATFGSITDAARNLANSLRRTKNLKILDGNNISDQLRNVTALITARRTFANLGLQVTFTPLIVPHGIAVLVIDAVQNRWFSLLGSDGHILPESDDLIARIRDALPHLKSMAVRTAMGVKAVASEIQSTPFDQCSYIDRCRILFDTAQYAGLAAVGMRLPVESLREIYVPTSANVEQRESAIQATERAIEELVETLELDQNQRDQLARQMKAQYGSRRTSEVGAASNLYKKFTNIVVLGDPGSGKSCFVRAEILSYCDPPENGPADWYRGHVPVCLPLAEYVYDHDSPQPLLDQCVSHAHGQGLHLNRAQIEILLSRGRIAFFFDGLDEVGSIAARQRVLDDLTHLVDKYAVVGNRFVLTSRPAATRDVALPTELARVSLLGLTDEEIEILVNRLFEVRHEKVRSVTRPDRQVIADILRDCKETPGIRRLARNPLLLTLLVFVYENSGSCAARRHLIYSQAIKTLVSVRHRDIRTAVLSESDLRVRLGRLAVAIFHGEASALPTREAVMRILADVATVSQESDPDFIQQVAETTGLLVIHPRSRRKADDLVSFMHYSFLEYYTAIGFLEDPQRVKKASQFSVHQRWREVLTLMFGVIGEQRDITPDIEKLCAGHDRSEVITVNRLMLAFDCALECDVPPEATQRFLAREAHKVISSGSGLFVPEVRQELGQRIQSLLEATGSEHIRRVIIDGIVVSEPEVAAAFVELAASMSIYSGGDSKIIEKISVAFARNERLINIAGINAMRSLPRLRSESNLQILRRIITRGGIVEKTAALQLLEEQPALVGRFARELADLVYGSQSILAMSAASAIIRGGLFELSDYTDFGLLDRALEHVISSDAPRRPLHKSVNLSWDRLEEWIYSSNSQLRQRGFRSLVVVESDIGRVHDVLFECLRTERDSTVTAVILDVLAAYPGAVEVASLAETNVICELTRNRHVNVRQAAARALKGFPTIQVVANALIEQYHGIRGTFTGESGDVVRAIAHHAVRDKACRAVLRDELKKVLRSRSSGWSRQNVSKVSELLQANIRIGMDTDKQCAQMVLRAVQDFRTPQIIRRFAMRLYGQICEMSSHSIRVVTSEFQVSEGSRRLAAYRSAKTMLQRCRGRFQTLSVVREELVTMQAELFRSWDREANRLAYKGDEPKLREIRNLLVDIESTLISYREFSERITAASLGGDLRRVDSVETNS